MTLDTSIVIREPLPVREVYGFCRDLLGTPAEIQPKEDDGTDWRRYICNPPGIGLGAWLWVYYGADGPMVQPVDADEDDDWKRYCAADPSKNGWAAIEVSFDTAYSYKAANGAGAADFHAWLIRQLGAWLDAKGVTWKWQNEFSGEWFDRYDGLDAFGDAEVGAPGSDVQRQGGLREYEAFGRLATAVAAAEFGGGL